MLQEFVVEPMETFRQRQCRSKPLLHPVYEGVQKGFGQLLLRWQTTDQGLEGREDVKKGRDRRFLDQGMASDGADSEGRKNRPEKQPAKIELFLRSYRPERKSKDWLSAKYDSEDLVVGSVFQRKWDENESLLTNLLKQVLHEISDLSGIHIL